MSEDVLTVAEFEEFDTTKDVVDKLQEAFIENLEGNDTILTGEEDWATEITADDAAQLMKLRKNAPESVSLISVSKQSSDSWSSPENKKDTGRGVSNGYDSTTVYQITCPKCHGVGESELSHGWNHYLKCGYCDTYMKM